MDKYDIENMFYQEVELPNVNYKVFGKEPRLIDILEEYYSACCKLSTKEARESALAYIEAIVNSICEEDNE